MRFQTQLVPATLIRRYKRFLADCQLDTGGEVTAHCANPGSMMGLAAPGTRVWLEPNDDPRKKLKFSWRLVEHAGGHFIGVDTGVPNRIVRAALNNGQLPGFEAYSDVRPEVAYGDGSRVDFLLSGASGPDAYVEVKSVTLSRQSGLAEFPDSVTARGTKHLTELSRVAGQGFRAVMLYVVQRTDATHFDLARDIDPAYAAASDAARAAGVETLAFGTNISANEITLAAELPVR